jgi:hypothetical protein
LPRWSVVEVADETRFHHPVDCSGSTSHIPDLGRPLVHQVETRLGCRDMDGIYNFVSAGDTSRDQVLGKQIAAVFCKDGS